MVSWGAELKLREKIRDFDINTINVNELTNVIEYLKYKYNCFIRYWKNYKSISANIDVIEAFCGEELVLPIEIDKFISQLGVVTATHDGCGFVGVSRVQEADKVEYILYTCSCHPWGDVTVYLMIPPSLRESVIKFANVVY